MARAKAENDTKKAKVPLKRAFEFYGYLLRYKGTFIPSLVALFITAALSLAFPYFITKLIGRPQDALKNGIDADQVANQIDGVVISLLIVLAVQAAVSFFRVQGFIRSGESALNDIRKDVFSKIVRLPMAYHMEQRAGELSGRVATDLGILRDTLLTTVPAFVRHFVILIGGLIAIFIASTKLASIMLLSVPIVVLAVAIIGKKIRGFSKAAQDSLSESQIVVEEAVQGISAVKSFTNELLEEGKYSKALEAFLKVTFRGALARAAFVSFIIFVMMGTIAAVIWVGAKMMVKGEITTEQFTLFIMFSVFVAASLGSLPDIMSQFQKTAGATERLQEMLKEPSEDIEESGAVIQNGSLAVNDLHFSYAGSDTPVIAGFNLQAAAGERVAIVGPSGAGKSTLFSLLLGFYEAQKGSILIDDKSLTDWGLNVSRGSMAVVPQDVILFGGTLAENIEYGKPGASLEEIRDAARKANALEFIESTPDGFDSLVGPRGMKLSGGQRQRIAIARAILADPKILLLDEATSALDSESERQVQIALDELMKNRTSLIIAHRLSTVKNADRIIVLSGGKALESGTHDQLMQAQGMYHVLATTQLL